MSGSTLFDKLKALAAGTLSSEEETKLRERCAADPELQRTLDEYLEVHAAPEVLGEAAPPCRVDFEVVEGALAERRVRKTVFHRYWRVAAAVLVLVGGAVALGSWFVAGNGGEGTGREAGTLVLASIPESSAADWEEEAELPALLGDYRPVMEGKISWIDSFKDARTLARLTSRPVLLFVHHPTCPTCISMKKDVFGDPDVQSLLTRFVPAMSNVMKERAELSGEYVKGWPWFGIVDSEGAVVLSFPGEQTPGDFAEHLKRATEMVGPSVMTWEMMNDLALRLEAARGAEKAGRKGEAYAAYTALGAETRPGVFGPPARNGSVRMAQEARRALVRARDLARSPPGAPAALAELDRAIEEFQGSPLATDLRTVRSRLETSGEFPTIAGL
jgi:hypothetical protein